MIEGFQYEEIKLQDDYEGEVIATFIISENNHNNRPVVLYIHGFIDYFFHPHLSEFFHQNEYDFYALELRKYGHSILPHQHKNYCRNLEEYFEEIDFCIQKIKQQNNAPLVLMGHSTGGLISSLYLNKGQFKDQVSALVLNSPFVETNVPSIARTVLKPMTKWISTVFPYAKLNGMLPPIYPSSLHKDFNGEWEFDLVMKPIEGFPVYFKWSSAIMDGQDYLKSHSNIHQPVVLLHSHDSYLPNKYESRVMKSDIVLNVEHMKEIGPKLGENVTLIEIENGVHDLFLSPKKVRQQALNEMINWLNKVI
ncbi:alpha/beta hydrolase [bacterium SCSIO 12643]|nr:alpha/beta hydrolase [bacterium SCSIO 12643]